MGVESKIIAVLVAVLALVVTADADMMPVFVEDTAYPPPAATASAPDLPSARVSAPFGPGELAHPCSLPQHRQEAIRCLWRTSQFTPEVLGSRPPPWDARSRLGRCVQEIAWICMRIDGKLA